MSTVTAAAQTFGGESYAHTVNIGGYAQDRLSFDDRLYTTVGFRIDGNSAFGKNYGYQRYPKVDARTTWAATRLDAIGHQQSQAARRVGPCGKDARRLRSIPDVSARSGVHEHAGAHAI